MPASKIVSTSPLIVGLKLVCNADHGFGKCSVPVAELLIGATGASLVIRNRHHSEKHNAVFSMAGLVQYMSLV